MRIASIPILTILVVCAGCGSLTKNGCLLENHPAYCLPPLKSKYTPREWVAYSNHVPLQSDIYGLGYIPTGSKAQCYLEIPPSLAKTNHKPICVTAAQIGLYSVDLIPGFSHAEVQTFLVPKPLELKIMLAWAISWHHHEMHFIVPLDSEKVHFKKKVSLGDAEVVVEVVPTEPTYFVNRESGVKHFTMNLKCVHAGSMAN